LGAGGGGYGWEYCGGYGALMMIEGVGSDMWLRGYIHWKGLMWSMLRRNCEL
jgi:hypothetical protein